MSKKEITIGIIGCGGIANGKHMPALSKVEGVRLTAFCDVDLPRAEKAAKAFGIPGAAVCADYRELLQNPEVQVVHVLTPNCSHSDISCAAMRAD